MGERCCINIDMCANGINQEIKSRTKCKAFNRLLTV